MKFYQYFQIFRLHDHDFSYKDVRFHFEPASLYAYVLGANILRDLDGKVKRSRARSSPPE